MFYVPKDTFLANYMEYMSEQETPTIYDFMCGSWVLSNALGRHTIVDRPRAPVHLNMYLILVSESGIMRKSTSIRVATALVRKHFEQVQNSTILVESKIRMSEMLNELSRATKQHDKAHMVLIASELAASFGRIGGAANLVALLTDLYDCPDVRTGGNTINNRDTSFTLRNVYCGFLAGSTPSWLGKFVTPAIIEGGFTSRCYFIVGKQRKRSIAWPSAQSGRLEAEERLLKQLGELHDTSLNSPRIGITHGALGDFTSWYDRRILHRDMYRESFESREDSHILRFAALFAANEGHWQINHDHLRRAIDVVAAIKDYGTGLFTGTATRSIDVAWIRRVRDTLLKVGDAGISQMDLNRTVNPRGLRTAELRATLHTMHELDLLQKIEMQYEGMRGRPRTVYKATEYLRNEQFLEDVVRKLGLES